MSEVPTQTDQQQAEPYVPPLPSPPKKKTRVPRWLRYLLVGIAGLAIGLAVGRAETTSIEERLFAMEDRALEAEDQLGEYRGELGEARGRITFLETQGDAELGVLQDRLDEASETIRARENRIADLQEKLDKLKKSLPAGIGRTIEDGTWRVGEEVAPGTYRAPGGGSCYWERLAGFSGDLDDIIANGVAERNVTVTIAPSDVGFHTNDCGTWTKIG
jgi:uncharacterized protein HemX